MMQCLPSRWPTPTATPTAENVKSMMTASAGASVAIALFVTLASGQGPEMFGLLMAAATVMGAWIFWPAIRAARRSQRPVQMVTHRDEHVNCRCVMTTPQPPNYVAMGDAIIATLEEVTHD
jgi:hypothetical protein